MENGYGTGAHTNHDRNGAPNGTNGASQASSRAAEKTGLPDQQQPPNQSVQMSGPNGAPMTQSAGHSAGSTSKDANIKPKSTPPEINHITEGFESLPNLLTRLAQVTHNQLSGKLLELAGMNIQQSPDNSNAVSFVSGPDDNSAENIKKKVNLLKFAEGVHSNWTKALVITQWSRISEEVSRVIDLKAHLDEQKLYYDIAVHELSEVKRSLVHARLPNPDLRTAVEVLSTGKASWMPDLGYIEPPPLTAKEILQSLQNLNTLLSIRLNLHDYDKIPYHFRNYTIKSGRVTFRVEGEFEVDLTIADEDPDKQFWFIDFRFLFSPSPSALTDQMRYSLEAKVNTVLEKDGLAGCYKVLHDLTLTHKVSELRRQAYEIGRSRWIDSLMVEPLRRSLSIQYWVDRYGKDGPKSWIIIGVVSGKKKGAYHDEKETSQIGIRWFRDSKEVKDVEIPLELTILSVEGLLRSVITMHVSHMLESMYKSLRTKPLYANRDLALSFKKPTAAEQEPELHVQLTSQYRINVFVEYITGKFAISPSSRLTSQAEYRLNNQTVDPASNGHEYIENLHCVLISEDTVSRAYTVGWLPVRNPRLPQDELKPFLPRDTLQLSWFKKPGWDPNWYLALSSGMSGERWWLIEITNVSEGPRPVADSIVLDGPTVRSHIQLPLKSVSPAPTYAFLSSLQLLSTSMISYYTNIRALHSRRAKFTLRKTPKSMLSSRQGQPDLYVMLSTLLPSKNKSPRTGKPWAKDVLKVSFQGIETLEQKEAPTIPVGGSDQSPSNPLSALSGPVGPRQPDVEECAIMIAEGHMETAIPAGLLVKQHVDKDIAFHPSTGAFAFRLQAKVGEPSIVPLIERLQRVERLVDFVQVINAHPDSLHCESVSLSRLIFSYGCVQSPGPNQPHTESPRYQAIIDFSIQTTQLELQLEAGNPHIRILDHLNKILNSPLGLHGLATILPLTLPVLRALDAAEDSWEDIPSSELQILCRASDWYAVRYILTPPSDGDNKAPAVPKRIVFEIRLHRRGNVPWWCMRRDQKHNAGTVDPLDLALKEKVWTGGEKDVWMGMQCAAIAQTSGAEAMVLRVDSAMRDLARDCTVFASAPPGVTGVKGEGVAGGNTDGFGGLTGQVQAQAVNVPNAQAQRPQTKSPVLQKQTQKKAQGPPTQQQRTQAALAEAQHRAQLQSHQLARQKEMHRQAQAQARQGQGQQRPNANTHGGNGNSGNQDAI
ncbi:mediator complex subunit [Pseudogymnoascus australis]